MPSTVRSTTPAGTIMHTARGFGQLLRQVRRAIGGDRALLLEGLDRIGAQVVDHTLVAIAASGVGPCSHPSAPGRPCRCPSRLPSSTCARKALLVVLSGSNSAPAL